MEGKGVVKKRSTRAVHSLRLFTCLHIAYRVKLVFLARDTRSRIRGPAVMIFMLWLRDFVVYDNFLHVLWSRDIKRKGRGWMLQRAVWKIEKTGCTGVRTVLTTKNGPILWASH